MSCSCGGSGGAHAEWCQAARAGGDQRPFVPIGAQFAKAFGLSDDPAQNTGPRFMERVLHAVNGLASLVGLAARKVEREHARMIAAEARLANVNRLLWMWVAADYPSGKAYAPNSIDFTANADHGPWPEWVCDLVTTAINGGVRQRIEELATVLGEDVAPENVQHMMQQRASALAQGAKWPG